MADIAKLYAQRIDKYKNELKKIARKRMQLSWLRLLAFLSFFVSAILLFSSPFSLLLLGLALSSLFTFAYFLKQDIQLAGRKKELLIRQEVNERELRALSLDMQREYGGEKYSNLDAQLAGDFFIFGGGSLFQYLNRSTTSSGELLFAKDLLEAKFSHKEIANRQQAIKELATKPNFMEDFMSCGAQIGIQKGEVEALRKWAQINDNPEYSILKVLILLLPSLNFALIIGLILFGLSSAYLSLNLTLCLAVVFAHTKKLNAAHSQLGRSSTIIGKYVEIITRIEKEDFSSNLLKAEKSKLMSGTGASKSIENLRGLLARFDYRFNIYASIFLNGLFCFDLHTFFALQKWRKIHGNYIDEWFDAISKIDSLIGLGCYALNTQSEGTTYAEISSKDFEFSAKNLSHPLIPRSRRVGNDFSCSARPGVTIITGANMAGKSTFLRSIAVNLILAMNGAPVAASEMRFSPCKLLSSIKIEDSLQNRESYFYSELRRLSSILEDLKREPRSFVILDEVLRGTNTRDKQMGSMGLLRKIMSLSGAAIISTHDLEIARLEDEFPSQVSNYCFEVEIDGENLAFDYLLKRGVSSRLNASLLMRKMGVID